MDPIGEADYVLSACGRRQAPAGANYVDLPIVLPFNWSQFNNTAPVTPAQGRLANNSKVSFFCRGIEIQSPVGVRIKWPSGRYWQQGPTWTGPTQPGNPIGTGGNLIALDSEIEIAPGAKVAIEMSGGTNGLVNIQFWGVLRYLLMSAPGGGSPVMIPDPIAELEGRPRYRCGPPQNIMAPEWLLGNQCTPETPDGFIDEPFTFFSPAIAVTVGGQVYGTAVIVPGSDLMIVKRIRAISTYSLDQGGSAIPVFAMRLPNGYSITGGDMVPTPFLFWWPVFPTMQLQPGDRVIIDMADMQSAGGGSISTVFEFEAVKRRKVAA
jgi:hypothetical protein